MLKIICIIPSACSSKTLPFIKKCVRSLRISAKNIAHLTIIVVSANPDARILLIGSDIDNFCLVNKSLGFAAMNNMAIEESMRWHAGNYYLLINDDAYVSVNFFKIFQQIAKGAAPEIICPLIYKLDRSIDSYGIEYFTSGFAKNAHSLTINTTLAQAACVLIKASFVKKLWKAYGFFFNPILHSYYEDTELSIRAIAIGGKIHKTTALIAYHRGSSSWGFNSKPVLYFTFRNILWCILLCWPKKYILTNMPAIVTVQFWFFICSIRDGAWWIYPKIAIDTIKHARMLQVNRNNILHAYTQSFASVFSPYWFRTRRKNKALQLPFFVRSEINSE